MNTTKLTAAELSSIVGGIKDDDGWDGNKLTSEQLEAIVGGIKDDDGWDG